MRISDWSSDVCSSDLRGQRIERGPEQGLEQGRRHAIQARVAMRPLRPSRRWEKKRRGSEIVHSPPPCTAPTPASTSRSRASAYRRSEEHTSELQSLMRTSYAVFCLKKKTKRTSH